MRDSCCSIPSLYSAFEYVGAYTRPSKKRLLDKSKVTILSSAQLQLESPFLQLRTFKMVRFSDMSNHRIYSNHAWNATTYKSFQAEGEQELQGSQIDQATSDIEDIEEEIVDTSIATKLLDGPSPAILAIQKLFLFVRRFKMLNKQQVRVLISSVATPKYRDFDSVFESNTIHDLQQERNQTAALPTGPPPEQMLTRLRAIADHIDANGRASLLPCTTALGRPYLPVARFLISCIAPPSASGAAPRRPAAAPTSAGAAGATPPASTSMSLSS
jgi:hypothetical protein